MNDLIYEGGRVSMGRYSGEDAIRWENDPKDW
jgi:hypothetical protein